MAFKIALSGLNAAATDLSVTGNNIANSSTVGFKESRTEFADVFAASFGGISKTAVGAGVRVAQVSQQFDQGQLDFTGNALDIAVNGQGFLIFSDSGSRVFSRNGAMQLDRDGYIVNSNNQQLQVYDVVDPNVPSFNTGSLVDLQLFTGDAPPQATSSVQALINLSAQDTPTGAPFPVDIDPTNPNTYNYSTSVNVYDSLGASHTATTYYQLVDTTAAAGATWNVGLTIDGVEVAPVTPSDPAVPDQAELTFDANGVLTTGMPLAYNSWTPPNGSAPLTLSYDYTGTTQYGDQYTVNGLTQDGFTTGRLTSINIDETGVVYSRYTNGQAIPLGKVALGDFANPQSLQQLGDNVWAETFGAGDLQLGEAGAGSFGLIQSGSLESSNVDISEQLVNLITAERNYQANAEVIQTSDAITQTIINLR
jgi:flagellar hook protein FlgE